jgi:hypothetical protein
VVLVRAGLEISGCQHPLCRNANRTRGTYLTGRICPCSSKGTSHWYWDFERGYSECNGRCRIGAGHERAEHT